MTQRGRATRPTGPTGRPRRPEGGPRGGERAPRGDLAARRTRLREIVEPVIVAAGYDLEDLSVSRAGRRHVVRVIVDTDGGVSLDAVAEVSRAVSAALDAAEEAGGDVVAGEYQLEVSSPGVDRPLTLPRHWRRNVGRLVKVTTRGGLPGERGGDRQVAGRVAAADDAGVTLETETGRVDVPYAELGPGRVQVEFSRPGETDDFDEADEVEELDEADEVEELDETDEADDFDEADGFDEADQPDRTNGAGDAGDRDDDDVEDEER